MPRPKLTASLGLAAAGLLALPNTFQALPAAESPPVWTGQGAPVPGRMYLANAALLDEGRASEYLTNYAVGYRDPSDYLALLDFVAPRVVTGRFFTFPTFPNAESFFMEMDNSDIRAIGADFKRVQYTQDRQVGMTLNKGLMMVLDRDQIAVTPENRRRTTAMLIQRLYRIEAYRAVNGLAAVAASTAKTWAPAAQNAVGVDPDQDVIDDIQLGGDNRGFASNRVLYDYGAWAKRARTFRGQNNAGSNASAMMTPEQVAGILGVDRIRVSNERFQASATTKGRFLTNVAISFFAEDGTLEDPSNAKRCVSEVDGGGFVRVFEYPIGAKLLAIVVEHYSTVIFPTTLGLRKLVIS